VRIAVPPRSNENSALLNKKQIHLQMLSSTPFVIHSLSTLSSVCFMTLFLYLVHGTGFYTAALAGALADCIDFTV
jgi:hypothetical protein